MERFRRGQAGASSLVALIAVFIVIYILFLPPDVREDLLENRTRDSSSSSSEGVQVLMRENPGNIFNEEQTDFEHNIPPFNIAVRQQQEVLKERDKLYVQTGGSAETTAQMILVIDTETTGEAILTFTVGDHSGNLIILVNGEQVFNGEIKTPNPPPIRLDDLESENIIEFKTSEPGWQFWNVNFYELNDVRIVATTTNYDNQAAQSTFFIGYNMDKIQKSTLRYIPECRVADVGKLTVRINGELVSSKVPDCGSPDLVEFDANILQKGGNTITFASGAGSYLVDNIVVKTELDEPDFPTYFFLMNTTQFGKITNGSRHLSLVVKFADTNQKDATVIVNDVKMSLSQREDLYRKDISPFAKEGNNYVRIEPTKTIPIQEIRVELR